MVWACTVCTFENRNDTLSKCEICETCRGKSWTPTIPINASGTPHSTSSSINNIRKSDKLPAKNPVQATLFGGIAKIPDKKTASNKSKKPNKQDTSDTVSDENKPNATVVSKGNDNNSKSSKALLPPPSTRQDTLSFVQKSSLSACTSHLSFQELKPRAKDIMKNVFRINKLRFLQPHAVTCGLKRQSQIVIMATGGGKSLCYQLPAVVLGGTSIVISPLIALMQDQVQALLEKNIQAAVISSNNGEKHNMDIMERLLGRSLRANTKKVTTFVPVTLLYVTPEQVQTNRFRDILTELNSKKKLTMFAVDEAHCLSSWGHDFRKSYMQLGYLRETYPDVPLMACTATATPAVLNDIKRVLHLENAPCHVGSFDRPNIFYKVKYKDTLDAIRPGGALGDLVDFVKKQHKRAQSANVPCTGIIYVHTRQQTSEITTTIQQRCGIPTVAYHAGLKVDERNKAQEAWTSGKAKIAVATVAFGMGIDLCHVRYVVHWTLSKNIESFYQESGRAGRDGLPSFSLVYYSKDDASKFQFLLTNRQSKDEKNEKSARDIKALEEIIDYCTVPSCRRYRLLKHFGEKMDDPTKVCNKTCDFCVDPDRVKRSIESATTAKDFTLHTRLMEPIGNKRKWAPSEDDDDFYDKPFSVDGLGITQAGASGDDEVTDSGFKPKANFSKASEILSKFEAIESKGFVHFKQKQNRKNEKTERSDERIRIPKHLIPTATSSKPPAVVKATIETKTSDDYAAEADRLRQELEKMKELTALRKQALEKSTSGSAGAARSLPAPPPPPTFTNKRKK